MARIVISDEALEEVEAREYSFTVVFEPLTEGVSSRRAGKSGRRIRRFRNPAWPGYQVTVPLLPGLITYGRTLSEARVMARDAIRCHIEGLRKDGKRIPNEKSARKEKLRVALSA
jgi:predicted RNase H-like HicB family nuclease